MKKIPTLFERVYKNHRVVEVKDILTPGTENAFYNGVATIKVDGSCCAVIDGVFYKRYDAKHGKKPPAGAIPCCAPDPVTGHWPHWVQVDPDNPNDRWLYSALVYGGGSLADGTYEAIGPHFQSNPYNLEHDVLWRHGTEVVEVARDFEHIKAFLEQNAVEGLVFWLDDEPVCKIKRSDFGLPWPTKEA